MSDKSQACADRIAAAIQAEVGGRVQASFDKRLKDEPLYIVCVNPSAGMDYWLGMSVDGLDEKRVIEYATLNLKRRMARDGRAPSR